MLKVFAVLFLPFFAWSFQMDWSGYYKAEGVFVHDTDKKRVSPQGYEAYGEQQLSLNAVSRISDGLLIQSHFMLGGAEAYLASSRRKPRVLSTDFNSIRLYPAQFYSRWTHEFFQLDIGRKAFHFGLGMSYSAGSHFSDVVYDVRDSISLKIQHNSFYVKPYAILYKKEKSLDDSVSSGSPLNAAIALQGGYLSESLGFEFLYKSPIYNSKNLSGPYVRLNTLNVHGYYKKSFYKIAAEWGYQGSYQESVNNSAGVLSAELDTKLKGLSLSLHGGFASDNYIINPNYNPTFMFWDYFYLSANIPQEDHKGGLSGCLAVSPTISYSFNENYSLSLSHSWMSPRKTLSFKNHELLVAAVYDSKKGFSWINKAGVLLMNSSLPKPSDIGVLTRFVISF